MEVMQDVDSNLLSKTKVREVSESDDEGSTEYETDDEGSSEYETDED